MYRIGDELIYYRDFLILTRTLAHSLTHSLTHSDTLVFAKGCDPNRLYAIGATS